MFKFFGNYFLRYFQPKLPSEIYSMVKWKCHIYILDLNLTTHIMSKNQETTSQYFCLVSSIKRCYCQCTARYGQSQGEAISHAHFKVRTSPWKSVPNQTSDWIRERKINRALTTNMWKYVSLLFKKEINDHSGNQGWISSNQLAEKSWWNYMKGRDIIV